MNAPASASVLTPTPAIQPVRMALVGGNFGAGIARNIARGNDFIQLAAVCDADAEKAARLAGELRVAACSDLDELFENPDIEAVGLFTPPIGRAKLIERILRAGRHVMTTKPFELDHAAASAVLAEASDRRLAVHLNSPAPIPAEDLRQINDWIREFQLGRPIAMRAETWANYREKNAGTWADDPAQCPAAPIFRLGIYFLNDFAALLGEPTRVFVTQSRIFTERPTSDNAQLTIEYSNGALANIFASFCIGDGKPWPDRVTLNYENGTVQRWIERQGGPDMANDYAVTELHRPNTPALRHTTRPGSYAGWYDWEAFHDAVRGLNNVPLQNTADILFGVRLLDAMRRSAASGTAETVA